MLSLTKKVMAKYKTLLVKMALDSLANHQVMLNYEHFCDLHILLELVCILPLLESMHVLSNLHNLDMYLCVIWCHPSRFLKVMFIRLPSSLLIAFGLSNRY